LAEKIRILHLWQSEEDARSLVQALARSGLEFEARLVRTESEYVSALVHSKFHIIVVDRFADFRRAGPDDLSALDIARELAPGIPFLLLEDPSCEDAGSSGKPDFLIEKKDLEQLGPLIRTALQV